MSIYATSLLFDDWASHDVPGCALYVPATEDDHAVSVTDDNGRTYWIRDDTKWCTCRRPPLLYEGSHILPADGDPRGGVFELAEIPGFIQREGRDLVCDEDACVKPGTVCCDRVWPYLRASVGAETVVLDRRQVEQVHAYLGGWLDRAQSSKNEIAERSAS